MDGMVTGLFCIFALVALSSAIGMVISRSGVNAALMMMVSFCSTAALFVLLEAYFLAALQVLVYAGAIVVLFLFIVMLLDAREAKQESRALAVFMSFFSIALLFSGVIALFFGIRHTLDPMPLLGPAPAQGLTLEAFSTAPKQLGQLLFSKYVLPFECAGFLLLSAMVGVIHLKHRQEEAL